MKKHLQHTCQQKHPKPPRKSQKKSHRLTKSGETLLQHLPKTDNNPTLLTTNVCHDLLTEIIEDLTSDIDETRVDSNTEGSIKSSKCSNGNETNDVSNDKRHEKLLKFMKDFHQDWFQYYQPLNTNSAHDSLNDAEKRKQYSTALWYELKAFFNGINTLSDNGIKIEQYQIDRERYRALEDFYSFFSKCDFEQSHYHDVLAIQRHHLCEYYLNHCSEVEKRMTDLFSKWDYILSLFPSFTALEEFDKRFDPRTKEGRIFYEKLHIFQAWFNLHSEINHLINVLGRIMCCTQCHMWPHRAHSLIIKSNESISSPTTPSSVSSCEHKESISGSSPNPLAFLAISDLKVRRQTTLGSLSSFDSAYQPPITPSSPIIDYYYRYIDDQITHARIELIASIFRLKHGPLLQRLRYTYRKEHRTTFSTFDDVFKNSQFFPRKPLPHDYLSDMKPDKLIDEFSTLHRKLLEKNNSKLGSKARIKSANIYADKINHIANHFDRNSSTISSTLSATSVPTLALKHLPHDRNILKAQSYFLDFLDPTTYPHLPGSTLFPEPYLFLERSPWDSYFQLPNDENIIINKMLTICHRLYDKHVWVDSGRFSDLCDIFHLPSLYPHYVFLVQIPLDLMIAWQKYHQDKQMEQTPTTGALMLLIDECKILIHSATLIRHYVRLMITDTFEKKELKLIEDELIPFDANIVSTMHEIVTYIERYVEISLQSNLFHDCVVLLKEQWRLLKKYATMMNMEEYLGEKFLNIYSKIMAHFQEYINIFHSSTTISNANRMEHVKKKIHRKYQKKMTMTILREAKAIYDDCALTINIYLQKPVCKRFLLILKTAEFERIKFVSENRNNATNQTGKDDSPLSKCLLFAPAKYFKDKSTKIQIIRTLTSSFRIHDSENISVELNEDQLATSQHQELSAQFSRQSTVSTSEHSPSSLVYILCVPAAVDLESEWRGVTHLIPDNIHLTPILPLHTNWKKTTIFLLTQQTQHLECFQESFKDRLSKINIQQNDLYEFDTRTGRLLQKRSCFEKVDDAMRNFAYSMLNFSNSIARNVESFQKLVEGIQTPDYLHTEERAFVFAMDVIRETSFYATQCEYNTFKTQAENQLTFANIWLDFVCKKISLRTLRHPQAIPMWLLPGIHFLYHVCSLHFSNHVDNNLFSSFYYNMKQAINVLNNSNNYQNDGSLPSRTIRYASATSHGYKAGKKKRMKLDKIQQLDVLDRRIDRRRISEGLIGKIKKIYKTSWLSRKMDEDLANLKIRNFHKLNLLSCGQYATTYKCSVNRNGKQEILCYKQYKLQHNNAQALLQVLAQLIPLIHIEHQNLIKYHGIALEHDHILFFMEYSSFGTIAQLLLGTAVPSAHIETDLASQSHADFSKPPTSLLDSRRGSVSTTISIQDPSLIDRGIVQMTNGSTYFQEFLVQRYSRQLLSALSRLHEKEIIHRDIRNVNIFLTDPTKQSIKLGDINFVYDFKFMKKQSSLLGVETHFYKHESVVFYAPETITQNETTTKSDIWSLGCTMLHMLTGRIPWNNRTTNSTTHHFKILNMIADGASPPIPADFNLSKPCTDFLEQCFQHDPNRRPSSQDLLEHEFVKE